MNQLEEIWDEDLQNSVYKQLQSSVWRQLEAKLDVAELYLLFGVK